MSEAAFSKKVCAEIRNLGGHVSKVEAAASAAGIPDLDFCVAGFEGHAELKVVSASVPCDVKATQVRWMRRRTKAGGRPFYLVYDEDTDDVYFVKKVTNPQLQGRVPRAVWLDLGEKRPMKDFIYAFAIWLASL